MNSDPEEDLPVGELPEEIGEAASDGDFERVKSWLAGGSASDPRSVNDRDDMDWTLLHWTAVSRPLTPGHVEFARYLISRGARVDAKDRGGSTALHFACESITDESTAALVSMLVAAGAAVNVETHGDAWTRPRAPLFRIFHCRTEASIDVVTALLRAGASLDSSTRSFEEHLHGVGGPYAGDVRTLVASVRAAGSWKAHCRLAHKEVLRLRSVVARGRAKLRTRRRRSRDACALEFTLRQGDNGIVWHILSYWRETG